jgi:PAS domain S-box-containing protein
MSDAAQPVDADAASWLRTISRAVEQSPASVVITDRDGRIEYVNASFRDLTGYSADEVLGQNPRIVKSGEMPPEVYAEMWSHLLSGREWRGELVNKKKNGELYREDAWISPVLDARGSITHFVAVKQDVTERRRLEEQVRQSQRMDAIGRLAGGIAHDFNNILNVISGYADLALRKVAAEAPERRHLGEIKKAAERAAGLTRQLLALGRRQVFRPRAIDLNAAVREAEAMLWRSLPENVRLVTALEPDVGTVRADPVQIEQVLLNLGLNARDAMPDGGILTLSTANASAPGPDGLPRDQVVLSVEDTGRGIASEIRDRIFEPFFTTGHGKGLGLAAVYGIVQQSGGSIEVTSEPGSATCFRVRLPRVDAAPARPAAPAAPPAAGHATILLAEDDAASRELTREVLEAGGYRVLVAQHAEEALALAHREPHIDLLVSDVIMPGLSGLELRRRLLQLRPSLRVLLVSGYATHAIESERGLPEGAELLSKPFQPDELLARVHQLLGGPPP